MSPPNNLPGFSRTITPIPAHPETLPAGAQSPASAAAPRPGCGSGPGPASAPHPRSRSRPTLATTGTIPRMTKAGRWQAPRGTTSRTARRSAASWSRAARPARSEAAVPASSGPGEAPSSHPGRNPASRRDRRSRHASSCGAQQQRPPHDLRLPLPQRPTEGHERAGHGRPRLQGRRRQVQDEGLVHALAVGLGGPHQSGGGPVPDDHERHPRRPERTPPAAVENSLDRKSVV